MGEWEGEGIIVLPYYSPKVNYIPVSFALLLDRIQTNGHQLPNMAAGLSEKSMLQIVGNKIIWTRL